MNGTTYIKIEFGSQPWLRLKGEHAFTIGNAIGDIFKASPLEPEKSFLFSAFRDRKVMEIVSIPSPDWRTFELAANAYGIRYAKLLEQDETVFIITRTETAERIETLSRLRKIRTIPASTSISYSSQTVVEAVQGPRDPALFTEDIARALEDSSAITNWSAEQYREYIILLASMPKFSAKNQELIKEQRPDAELVASKTLWRSLGRNLVPGATPISIWKPVEGEYKKFEEHSVYDVRDTITFESPSLADLLGEQSKELEEAYAKALKLSPVPIKETPGAKGTQYQPDQKEIIAPISQGDPEQLSELLREIAHAQIHYDVKSNYSKEQYTFMAESVSCALATKLRVPSYIYEFDMRQLTAEPSKIKDYINLAQVMIEGLTEHQKKARQAPVKKTPDIERE